LLQNKAPYTVTFSTKNILLNQLNCHKSRLVHSSLELATPNDLFIYFLLETYNHKGNPCGLTKSYLHYLPDVDSRAAIYALPELGFTANYLVAIAPPAHSR
jgi:hypothetical protein